MDIMELGAIGELVGGVAVIASLVFVGLQVRQSVTQTKVSSYQSAVIGYADRIERLATDDGYQKIFASGLTNFRELSPEEQFKFHGLMLATMSTFQNNLNLFQAGVLPADEFLVYERDIVGILKTPGASAWWNAVRHLLATRLQQHIDRIMMSLDATVPALTESVPFFADVAGSPRAKGD